ncbi:MAG TPA: hypothetical protein VFF06_31035 [Polyangia bacterium]|nr:hypothetical protein [Polyangia bacterium]
MPAIAAAAETHGGPSSANAPREASPHARLTARASLLLLASLAATVLAPLWLLLLAPIVLGVPHVVADLRWLVLRPGVERRVLVAIAPPLAAMTALRVINLAGGGSWPAVEIALGGAAIAGAIAFSVERASTQRAAIALAAAALLIAAGLLAPRQIALWLGHAHNLVAFGLLLAWWPAPSRNRAAVALVFAACAALIALGALDPLSRAAGGFAAPSTGLDFAGLTATLAPGLAPTLALRLVLLFAFAQAVHYAVWLSLLPRAVAPRAPLLSSLRAELGTPGLLVAAALALAVPACGLFAPARTRALYLSLVLFHGWLELALIARLAVRGKARS